jgi:D-hydroxyproline dehydrogenase subunit alpha
VCYECRVTIDGAPHQRACVVACKAGMCIETAPGGAPAAPEHPADPPVNIVRAEVAVVGAGPAGIAAACRAAEAGQDVVVLDEAPAPGGQVWRQARTGQAATASPGGLAAAWLRRLAASGARMISATAVVDALPGGALLARSAGSALRIEAQRLVLATGARELFLPFPGWTLPNVLGVGAAQALLKAGEEYRGKRIVVAGSGPLLLPVAAALAGAGARIVVVAEQAPGGAVRRFAAGLAGRPRLLAQAALYRAAFWRSRYRCGVWVQAALARLPGEGAVARGGTNPEGGDDSVAVRGVVLTDGSRSWTVACDVLACAYGLVPNLEIPGLLGCRLENGGRSRVQVDERQESSLPGIYCAGETTGIAGLGLALASGQIAGLSAAGRTADSALLRARDRERRSAAALEAAFRPRPELRQLAAAETLVCRCEDVPFGRLDPGWTARQAKLYTRAGMGPCQGRICGPALEHLFGWDEPTSFRPPLAPLPLATLAELAATVGEPRPIDPALQSKPVHPRR